MPEAGRRVRLGEASALVHRRGAIFTPRMLVASALAPAAACCPADSYSGSPGAVNTLRGWPRATTARTFARNVHDAMIDMTQFTWQVPLSSRSGDAGGAPARLRARQQLPRAARGVRLGGRLPGHQPTQPPRTKGALDTAAHAPRQPQRWRVVERRLRAPRAQPQPGALGVLYVAVYVHSRRRLHAAVAGVRR